MRHSYGESDPLSWTSEDMNTNMIVLLCLSALFPVLMGTDEVKSNYVLATDCSDSDTSESNGVYTISTVDGPVQVYCDVESGKQIDQGHWTVILRRMNGEVNFFRPYESYTKGFGNKTGEHWLGLEILHQLTSKHKYQLRVDLEDFKGRKVYALYESFSVGSKADGYRLHVSGFVNGGAGDSLYYHNGMKFTTYDKDQDNSGSNCAMIYFGGGFWYNGCYYTNPTGHYLWRNHGTLMDTGATWYHWKNSWDPLKSIIMKIKRVM